MYELRIAYAPDTTIGESDVRSRHEDIDQAAEAFVHCTAPLRQIIYVDDKGPRFLDEVEERRLTEVCDRHGFDLDEIQGDQPLCCPHGFLSRKRCPQCEVQRPKRPCLEAGCPNYATSRGRCDDHRKARDASEAVAGARRLGASTRNGYGGYGESRRSSATPSVLGSRTGRDAPGSAPSSIMSSLLPGGEPYSAANLQLLCAEHHRLKTARENAVGRPTAD